MSSEATNKIGLVAWAALTLAACSAPAGPQPSAPAGRAGDAEVSQAQPAPAPSLEGRWRIVEVNGVPARARHGGSPEQQPSVTFIANRFGGNSGCNGFGGIGVMVGNRWFAVPPMSTLVGCADLRDQERAVYSILSGGPTVAFNGADEAVLRTSGATMRLARSGPAPAIEEAAEPMLMAGNRWAFGALDGTAIELPGERLPPRLTFEADSWTLETPCLVQSGSWRQEEGAVVLDEGSAAPRACRESLRSASMAWVAAIGGRLHYTVGPNGEYVLASGEHWAVGSRDISLGSEEPQLLSGQWRVVSANGAAPPQGELPAELAFGPGGFAVWDGCRHSEGVSITADRQLFTHGSGMVTMANCPQDPIRRAINAVVAATPRIARTSQGGVALVSRLGTLRLERTSRRAFGTGIERRLRSGWAFDLLLPSGGPARLTLGAGSRFTVALSCGTIAGRWLTDRPRSGGDAWFEADRPPPACDRDPAALSVHRVLNGEVLAAIGPNRDIALFVSRGRSLPARFA